MTRDEDLEREQKKTRGNRKMFSAIRERLYPSRTAPARTTTQAQHVRDRLFGGSTKAMAAAYNVHPSTVRRWITGGQAPKGPGADRLRRDAAAAQTTPRGRARRARQFEAMGGAYSGFNAIVSRATSFEVRGSDAVRPRDIRLSLSGEQVARLAAAETDDDANLVIREAVADYFNGGGGYTGFGPDDFEFDASEFRLQ